MITKAIEIGFQRGDKNCGPTELAKILSNSLPDRFKHSLEP